MSENDKMTSVVQRRFMVELRALEGSGSVIEGHAAVFGVAADLGTVVERLAPTAFDRVMKAGPDVRALKNHDPNMVLGRSGRNLELEIDDVGLRFRIDPLPDTQAARDLREEMAAGLITGASFAFLPDEEDFERMEDGRMLRTHTSVAQLLDVSPVTFPAYESTEVSLRSMQIIVPSARERALRIRHNRRFKT